MKITANEEYGLRIMLVIAKLLESKPDSLVSLNEIAELEGISVENTAAIVAKLKQSNLVSSIRGKYGGYRLTKSPEQINLYQITNALGKESFDSDFCDNHSGQLDTCIHANNCSIRPVWTNLSILINNFLQSISLQSLMSSEQERNLIMRDFELSQTLLMEKHN